VSVKSDRAKTSGTERRAFPVQLEVRAKKGVSNVSTIEGYASVTETPFEMWDWLGPYSEVVRTGAFGKTLAENPQVQLLLNHGGLAMAYTKAGSPAPGGGHDGPAHGGRRLHEALRRRRHAGTALEDQAASTRCRSRSG
jgi:hypothetical protein